MIFFQKGILKPLSLKFYFILIISCILHILILIYVKNKSHHPTHLSHASINPISVSFQSTKTEYKKIQQKLKIKKSLLATQQKESIPKNTKNENIQKSAVNATDHTSDHIERQILNKNPFGVLALPQSVLGQNLFPRKYDVQIAITSKENSFKIFTLKSLLPLSKPMKYLDEMVKTALKKQLENLEETALNSWISLKNEDMIWDVILEFDEQGS